MVIAEIERQGVLKGYVRADELWKFAVETLDRTRDTNGKILELIGFDVHLLETTLATRSDEESAGKEEELSGKIRTHYKNELWRVHQEMLEISAAVAVHSLFLDGTIKVWHCSKGVERYLTSDEFRVNPGGAHLVYGQLLAQSALDTPYHSWRTGFASIGDTNGTIDDPALYGKTLMVSDDDCVVVRRVLVERFPPSKRAQADDARAQMVIEKIPWLLSRNLWDVQTTVAWVAFQDIEPVAEAVVDWKINHVLADMLGDDPTAIIDVQYLDESGQPSAYLPSRRLLDAMLNGTDLGVTGRFAGEGRSKPVLPSDVIGRHFCSSGSGDFVGAMGQAIHGNHVRTADINAISFDRVKVMAAFPPTSGTSSTPSSTRDFDAPDKNDWKIKAGEQQQLWVTRNKVLEEAHSRWKRNGRMRSSNRALAALLSEMAAECDLNWKASTLETVLRNAGVDFAKFCEDYSPAQQ